MTLTHLLAASWSNFQLTDLLLPVGLIFMTIWMMMRLARRRRQGNTGAIAPTPTEHLERVRQQKGVRHDLEELMVDIEQFAKRVGAQLDAKSMRLEHLIEEADRKMVELKRLQQESAEPPPHRPSAAVRPSVRQPSAAYAPAAEPNDTSDTGDEPSDALARSVYAMADAGRNPNDIARELNEHVGKVELILALRASR